MAYNVKTNSLTKEGGKTKRILLFNNSCKKGDMVVSVNNVFKLMNDVVLGDIYNGIVGKVEEDSENASTKPVLVTLFDDTMTVNVAVEDTETGEVVEATVQGNVLQEIVEETIEDIEEDKSYAYRFLNYDGTVLQQGRAMKGTAPTYTGSTPTRESSVSADYTFSGWQPAIAEFDTDTDLVAQYSETARMYWVTFENYDGTTLQSTKVAYGETPSYVGETPTNPAGPFDGWTPEIAPVTGDATYIAVFITHSYQSAPEIKGMSLRMAIQDDNPDIDVMMIEGVKKVTSRGSEIVSTEYLAGGEADNLSTDEDGMVFIQTNANSELVAYVFKTREELGDDYMTYREIFMMPENMTDEIWNTMQGWFQTVITTTVSGNTTTIAINGTDMIEINNTTHAMRYAEMFYEFITNTATEYNTLDTNGWLTAGTYDISTSQASIDTINGVISSIKSKSENNLAITHNTQEGEIVIAGDGVSLTIQDKNLGATQVYNDGDTLSEANCGKYYQRGNNYGFPRDSSATITTSSTAISNWSDGYNDSTFITTYPRATNFTTGDTWETIAPTGYHLPSKKERQTLVGFMKILGYSRSEEFKTYLHIPYAGFIDSYSFTPGYVQNTDWRYLTSPIFSSTSCTVFVGGNSDTFPTNREYENRLGCSIRLFKNTTPTPTFDEVDEALYNCPQIETALDVLNQVILSAPQVIADYVMSHSAQFGNEYSLTSTRGLLYTVIVSGGVYTGIIVSHSTNWGDNKASWNSSTGVWVNPSANMNTNFEEEDI